MKEEEPKVPVLISLEKINLIINEVEELAQNDKQNMFGIGMAFAINKIRIKLNDN